MSFTPYNGATYARVLLILQQIVYGNQNNVTLLELISMDFSVVPINTAVNIKFLCLS